MDGSKKSGSGSVQAPVVKYQPGAVYYGGQELASSKKEKGRGIVTRYNPTQSEEQARGMAFDAIPGILEYIKAGGSDARANELANAYVDDAVSQFDRTYKPAMRDMGEDYARRFRTLNATPYLDKFSEMEQNVRVPAYQNIARQGTLLKQDLMNQDQQRAIQQLQAMGYALSGNQQQFLQGVGSAVDNAKTGTNIALQNAANQMRADMFNRQMSANNTNSFLGFLGGLM